MRGRASQTAEYTCFQRAQEHDRPEAGRIVDDPYARRFLPGEWRAQLRVPKRVLDISERLIDGVGTFCLARHRALDELLGRALRGGAGEPAAEQVLLVGAGYDTRAWRFAEALNGRPFFEVDHPATAARKAEVLAISGDDLPEVDRRVVTVDFTREQLRERLLAEGFETGKRTVVLWEGVSMYLPEAAVRGTLGTLGRLCGPGSWLGMDFWFQPADPGLRGLWHRLSPRLLGLVGEPVLFGLNPLEARAFLASEGVHLERLLDARMLAEDFVPDSRPVLPSAYVVTARLGG